MKKDIILDYILAILAYVFVAFSILFASYDRFMGHSLFIGVGIVAFIVLVVECKHIVLN